MMLEYFVNPYLLDFRTGQIKYPRSRKKRIKKKFKKLWTRTWTEPKKEYYHLPDQGLIIYHPAIAKEITNIISRI